MAVTSGALGGGGRRLGAVGRLRTHGILRFTARRVLEGVATLLVVSFLIFVAVQLLPGNVVTTVLGRNGSPQAVQLLTHELHLSDPFMQRYWSWLTGFLSGNFGHPAASIVEGDTTTTVWQSIHTPLVNSLVLAGITLVLLVPLSFGLGVTAALRAGRGTDRIVSAGSLVFAALPEFLLGTILIVVFFSALKLLPPISAIPPGDTPYSNPKLLVLPVLTLLGVSLAASVRMIRAGTIEILQTKYVAMARMNGLRRRRVILRYALRNAVAPSIQVYAQTAQYLLGGIIIVESVFDYPGIGTTFVQAVSTRDVQVIADVAMILATAYVAINIIADLTVVLLVPRLRTGQR